MADIWDSVMDYSSMSLVELKQCAKGRRIKQYYIMKRQQLIQLLSMKELPEALIIEKMTIHQLREKAKEAHIRGFWNLRREQLVEILFPQNGHGNVHQTSSNQDEKNQGNADKHNQPEEHNTQEVWVENIEDA